MAATDARPVPRRNQAFRLSLAMRDTGSNLVTSWSGKSPDTEISKDAGSFADCTNEITEIGTAGCGYIDLTAAEMNCDTAIIKTTLTGAVPLVIMLYPESSGDYRCDMVMIDGAPVEVKSIVDANVVQVSGIPVARRSVFPSNLVQVSGENVSINDFGGAGGGGDATAANQTTIISHLTDIKGTGWSSSTDTLEDIRAQIGTDGAGLTNMPWNASWDAQVESEVYDALNAAIPGSPTAGSVFERVKTLDDNYTSTRAGYLNAAISSRSSHSAADVYTAFGTGANLTAVGLSSTALANVNAEVDTALNTAIPGSPTANSINERLAAIDNKLPSKTYLAGSNNSDGDIQLNEATGSFASGAITATSIAADAIGASELAADAVTEIAAAVWNATLSSYDTPGSTGHALVVASGNLISGNWSTTGEPLTSSEVATAVWNAATASYGGAGTYGQAVEDILVDTSTTLDDYVDQIESELAKVPKSDGSVTWNSTALASIQAEATDALNAYDPPTQTEMTAAFTEIKGVGWTSTDTLEGIWTDTNELVTDVNAILVDTDTMEADIKSYGDANWATATGFSTHSAADVWTASGRSLSSAIADFDDLTASGVNLVAINGVDVSTYTEQDIVDAIWDEPVGDHQTAGTTGEALVASGVVTPANVWNYATRTLSTQDWSTHDAADVVAAFGTGSSLTQVGLSTTALNNVQTEAEQALAAYDAATGTDVSNAQSAIISDLDEIKGAGFATGTHSLVNIEGYVDAIPATLNNLSQADIRTAVGLASANLDTQLGDIPTVSEFNARTLAASAYFDPAVDTVANVTTTANLTNFPSGAIADAVWDEQIAGHATTGTTGKAVSDVLVDTSTTLNNYVDEIESLLKNGTYGLQAIENIVDTMEADIKSYGDSNWATATGFATPAMIPSSGDIAGAVWDASINDHQDIGSTGFALNIASGSYFATNYTNATLVTVLSYLDAFDLNGIAIKTNGLTAIGLDTTAVDEIVDQVWNEVLSGHQTIGSAGYALNVASGNLISGNWSTIGEPLTSSEVATAVWNAATASYGGAGTYGQAVEDILVDTNEIEGDLDGLIIDIGANGAGLTAIPWNISWDAEVQSEVEEGLAAYDAATGTDVSSAQSTIVTDLDDIKGTGFVKDTHSLYQIEAYVDGIEAKTNNLPSDPADQSAVEAAITAAFTEIKGAGWSSSTDTLEDIRDEIVGLNDLSTTEIRTAVWDATMSSYDTPGTTGHALVTSSGNLIGGASTAPTAAAVADAVWDEVLSTHSTNGSAGRALALASGTLTAAQVWGYATRDLSGTINSFDELDTALDSAHGAGSWETATGFSTHSAADVYTAFGTGSNLTQVGLSTTALNNIQSEAEDALAAYDAATGTDVSNAQSTIVTDLDDIKGTGFVKDTHSLVDIEAYVDQVEGYLTNGTYGLQAIENIVDTMEADIKSYGDSNWSTATGFATPGDIPSSGDIAGAVWDETLSDHDAPGSTGHALVTASGNLISGDWGTATLANQTTIIGYVDSLESRLTSTRAGYLDYLDDIYADTNQIQGKLPSATYLTGTSDSTGAINNGALATSAVDEIVDGVWNEAVGDHVINGSTGQALITSSGNLIGGASTAPSAAEVADAVWNRQLGQHLVVDSAGWALGIIGSGIANANMVQVSGEYVTLQNIQTGDIDTTGLATTTQLEYWALMILNNCGGGPVG